MPKPTPDTMTVIAFVTGGLTEPKDCSCVYLEAGKIRLAVHYDPIKKCMCVRSTTGHQVSITPEANNAFQIKGI